MQNFKRTMIEHYEIGDHRRVSIFVSQMVNGIAPVVRFYQEGVESKSGVSIYVGATSLSSQDVALALHKMEAFDLNKLDDRKLARRLSIELNYSIKKVLDDVDEAPSSNPVLPVLLTLSDGEKIECGLSFEALEVLDNDTGNKIEGSGFLEYRFTENYGQLYNVVDGHLDVDSEHEFRRLYPQTV